MSCSKPHWGALQALQVLLHLHLLAGIDESCGMSWWWHLNVLRLFMHPPIMISHITCINKQWDALNVLYLLTCGCISAQTGTCGWKHVSLAWWMKWKSSSEIEQHWTDPLWFSNMTEIPIKLFKRLTVSAFSLCCLSLCYNWSNIFLELSKAGLQVNRLPRMQTSLHSCQPLPWVTVVLLL